MIPTYFIVVIIITLEYSESSEFVQFEKADFQLSQGQHLYEDLQLRKESPRYGSCWTEAIRELHDGCKRLTEAVQQRLALQFAKCFLASAGKPLPDCSESSSVRECLAQADGTFFSAYQTYFVHTQSICFYLKSELWQENTQNLITKLGTTAYEVTKRLSETGDLQREILRMQSQAVETQENILNQGEKIGETIEISHHKALETFELYRQTTVEQKDIINRIFNRVLELQSTVFGIFSGFNSFVFYIVAFLISYFLTSQSRTSGARFWMIITWATCLLFECRFKPKSFGSVHDAEELEFVSQESWTLYLRSMVSAFNALILLYHYKKFRDYSFLNWQAQHSVERKVSLLFHCVERLSGKLDNMSQSQELALREFASQADNYSDEEYDPEESSSCHSSSDSEEEAGGSFIFNSPDSSSFSQIVGTNDVSTLSLTSGNNESSFRYNLRSRRSLPASLSNPLLRVESPRKFANTVKMLANKNIDNRYSKAKKTELNQFSSDDE